MTTLRIGLAQLHQHVGVDEKTLTINAHAITAAYHQGIEMSCDLVMAPELSLCGYGPEDLLYREDVSSAIETAGNELCAHILDKPETAPALLFGSPRRVYRANDGTFPQDLVSMSSLELEDVARANAIMCVQPEHNSVHEVYKMHLPNWGVFDEVRWFESARSVSRLLDVRGVKVGVLTCRDIWIESAVRDLVVLGAQLIVVPNASPYANARHEQRVKIVGKHAKTYGLPIAYVNTVGGCDEAVFDGGSFAVDAHGDMIAHAVRFDSDFIAVDLEVGESQRDIAPLAEHHEEISGQLIYDGFDPDESYSALIVGVRDFINAISPDATVAIGISGGIDSALVATLAVDALGADRVHGVLMPSQFTSQRSTDGAYALIGRLGITSEAISIEKMHETSRHEFGLDEQDGLVSENIQSRLRGMILMMLSNRDGHIILSTGNKTEAAVGYCTLYGDTVGGFAPIKDIYKTQVFEVCEWRNTAQGFEVNNPIPQDIIDRPPTAELHENQTDEAALYPYEVLDAVLIDVIEYDKSIDDIVARGYDQQTVEHIIHLVKTSEFKRKQMPVGPRLTRRHFGKSRRIPIAAQW